jgi:putative ABC transport system ATP-binding protein
MAERILVARGVRKVYRNSAGEVTALSGVSFTVDAGSVTAIVGPSGAGKTTLLNVLAGLDRPTDGEVAICGQRLADLDDDAATDFRRRRIGFVFQFFNLIPTMSAYDNVALPLLADRTPRREIAQRVAAVLSATDLGGLARRRASELSGGEMQRVAIARALVMEPRLILADEPTGNLDSATGEKILELMCDRARDADRALLIVTHSPAAAAHADRVLALHDGRIVEERSVGARSVRRGSA